MKADSDVEYPLAKIVSLTGHKDVIRRGGVISIIKSVSCDDVSVDFERVVILGTALSMLEHIRLS